MVSPADRPVAGDVTVVVPTVGRPLLKDCLRSIAAGSVWPASLVLVDQGQESAVQGWADELRHMGVRVIHVRSCARGIAAATNLGFDVADTEYVCTTHDDCRVRPDWLELMARRVVEVNPAILTGRVEPEGSGLVLTIVTSPRPVTYRAPLRDRDVLFPPNMAFPRSLLEEIGYLDEHPSLRLAGEDNDWAYRALSAGIPIVYDPEIVVGHVGWQGRDQITNLHRRYARGQGAFYGKHLRRGDSFILRRALRDLARAPWLTLRGAVTRNPDLLAMGVGALEGLPPGILAGLRNPGIDRDRRPDGSVLGTR